MVQWFLSVLVVKCLPLQWAPDRRPFPKPQAENVLVIGMVVVDTSGNKEATLAT